MTIDPTGVLRWQSPQTPGSPFTITTRVTDTAETSGCAWSEQTYQLAVSDGAGHRPPAILSTPVDTALTNSSYQYQVIASSPDGDNISFDLDQASKNRGMQITNTGLVTWTTPLTEPPSPFPVTVKVIDQHNASAEQPYMLAVRGPVAPMFGQPLPPPDITGGLLYRYDAHIRYDDTHRPGDFGPITFRFDVDAAGNPVAPSGMTVDNLGRVSWRAPILRHDLPLGDPLRGPYPVRLIATDGYNQSAVLAFSIAVNPDQTPPLVDLQISPNQADPGHNVFFYVQASDNVGVTSRRLFLLPPLDNQELFVNDRGTGVALGRNLSVGVHHARAIVMDAAGNQTVVDKDFTVRDHGAAPPQVHFTNAQALRTVTEPTDVKANITSNDPNTLTWTLRLVPVNGGQRIDITPNGTGPVQDGVVGRLDPTLLPDGAYFLQLHADALGGDDGEEITVNIRGKLKLGDFKLSFTDLTVPVAGIPISVRRTYDSLQANTSRDFGYGWKLEFGDADLKVDFGPDPFQAYGQYPAFMTGERIVVSRPGADPEAFTFTPIPHETGIPGLVFWQPAFTPEPGVTSQLRVRDDFQLIRDVFDGTRDRFHEYAAQIFYNPANEGFGGVYHLITLDGIDHKIDAVTGKLLSLSDRHHNEVTFSPTAIQSNRSFNGRRLGIAIERDAQQRITKITDPNGNSVLYDYDGHGDLYQFRDRLGQATLFDYNATDQNWPPHFLATITDPLHQMPVQVAYHTDAHDRDYKRLDTLTDATRQVTQLGYDFSTAGSYKQSIKDPTQKTTTLVFDGRGNLKDALDQTHQHTMATYDGNDFVKTVTQVGDAMHPDQVTQYDYDGSGTGLPTAVTDGEGKITRYSYNRFGQVTSVTDPLTHTVYNTYDPQTGDLLSVQAPATSPTDYRYDGAGNVTATSFGGATSQYMYDSVGHLTETVSPTGVHHTMMYDANGNRTEEDFRWVDPDGVRPPRTLQTKMMYDANDRLTITQDPEGKQTQYMYDALNRVKQTTDIYGGVSSTKYDKRGLVVEQTTPLGTVTRTAYDVDGRPEYVTDAFVPGTGSDDDMTLNDTTQNWTPHQWQPQPGRMYRVEIISGTGAPQIADIVDNTATQLTIAGHWTTRPGTDSVYTINEPVYSTTQTHYNALGQADYTIDSAGLKTDFLYNGRGEQTREIAVVNMIENCDLSAYCTKTGYDDAGRATSVTDRAGKITTTEYDEAGRPKKVIYADGKFTQTGYDAQGRKQSQTDEMGLTTTYMYDPVARLQSVTQPQVYNPETGQRETPVTRYDYDNYGNLKKITDAKSRQTLCLR